jgi:hypothetical protein
MTETYPTNDSGATPGLRYVVALNNPHKPRAVHHCWYTDDTVGRARRDKFVAKYNGHPDFGIFYCVGALSERGTAKRDRVVAVYEIVLDQDLVHIEEPRERVLEILKGLPLPPSEIRTSGHGLHAVWYLKEPATGDDVAVAAEIMEALSRLLAGDGMVTRPESLLRLPGTVNTKDLDPAGYVTCEAVWTSPTRADLTDFDVLLDMRATRGTLLTLKEGEKAKANGHTTWADGAPDTRSADETLAQLHYGTGRFHTDMLHATFMATTVDLQLTEVTVNRVFNRAREVLKDAPEESEEWQWCSDRWSIEEMCYTLINKDHSLAGLLPPDLLTVWNDCVAAGLEPKVDGRLGEPWRVVVDKSAAAVAVTARLLTLREYEPVDPRKFPRRQWVWANHVQRGVVSATVGHGGFGKTKLKLAEFIAAAAKRDFMGHTPRERLRVWFHNGEDDLEELTRCTLAICQHFGIDQEDLKGWLYLTSGNEFPLRVARGSSDLKLDTRLINQIKHQITDRRIDMAGFDPLITLHGTTEGGNSEMDQVIDVFKKIAADTRCGIDISCHTRKPPAGTQKLEYNGADMRGVTAIYDAMRSVRILNVMSEEEAKAAQMPTDRLARKKYVRIDDDKGNNRATAAKAQWMRFVSVTLPNAGGLEPGDSVGVLEPWEYPDPGENPHLSDTADDVYLYLLGQFDTAGRYVSDAKNSPSYAPKLFAKEATAKKSHLSAVAFEAAQQRLFAAQKIRVGTFKRNGRDTDRIERT